MLTLGHLHPVIYEKKKKRLKILKSRHFEITALLIDVVIPIKKSGQKYFAFQVCTEFY